MANDALKVVAKEPSKPPKMIVPGRTADIYDPILLCCLCGLAESQIKHKSQNQKQQDWSKCFMKNNL